MGSGWHEWPLVIFTVFGQCVAGALIVMGFAWLNERDDKARIRIVRSLFFSLAGNGYWVYGLGTASWLPAARLQLA
ncbi:anaerobic dimethyl sulfoxide reductase subunit YnfH [Enterobacter hormaechei]|nr:anaerobic dimethyl sulfoxide reductase subunit YnfH [Enterobacter hormaechei]